MGSTCKSSFDLIMASLSEFVLSHNDLGADFQSWTLDLWMFGAKGREPWYLPRFSQVAPSLISALLVGSLFDIFIRWQIVSHALPFPVDQAEEDRGAKYIKAAPFLVKIAVSPRDKVTGRISRLDVEHPDNLTYDEIIFLRDGIFFLICLPLLGNLKSTNFFPLDGFFKRRESG